MTSVTITEFPQTTDLTFGAEQAPAPVKRWVWCQNKIEKYADTKHLVFECEGGTQEYVYPINVADPDEFMHISFNSGGFKVYDTVDELLTEIKERMPKPEQTSSES